MLQVLFCFFSFLSVFVWKRKRSGKSRKELSPAPAGSKQSRKSTCRTPYLGTSVRHCQEYGSLARAALPLHRSTCKRAVFPLQTPRACAASSAKTKNPPRGVLSPISLRLLRSPGIWWRRQPHLMGGTHDTNELPAPRSPEKTLRGVSSPRSHASGRTSRARPARGPPPRPPLRAARGRGPP